MSILVTRPLSAYPVAIAPGGWPALDAGGIRAAAWLAQLAYETDEAKIRRILGRWGLRLAVNLGPLAEGPFPAVRTQGLIVEDDRCAAVAFAGTDPLDLADLLTDVSIRQDPNRVHGGFAKALESVAAAIATYLAARPEVLVATGHSLGAALAALCAHRFVQDRILFDRVFAFGMPRVGGPDFAAAYEPLLGARSCRLVHGRDVVPKLPPAAFGYRHVGRRLSAPHLGRFDPAAIRPEADDEPCLGAGPPRVPELPQLAQIGDLMAWLSGVLPDAIGDHLPNRYCEACGP